MLDRIILFLLAACVLFACQSPSASSAEEQEETATEAFTFEQKEIKHQTADCESEGAPCAQVVISMPVVSGGPEAARHTMNGYLKSQIAASLAGWLESPPQTGNMDTLALAFLKNYEMFIRDFPETAQQWMFEAKAKVIYQSPEVVSFIVETYAYTGGAHPNSATYYISFDAQRGRELTPEDFVTDKAQLTREGEKVFREELGIGPEVAFGEVGFSFPDETFFLPNNFARIEDGLVFYYNPYEIASYASGPTELVVSQKALGSIWK